MKTTCVTYNLSFIFDVCLLHKDTSHNAKAAQHIRSSEMFKDSKACKNMEKKKTKIIILNEIAIGVFV